ncbi:MAG: hypothetical protein JRE72_14415 [Deltaproteobacteria bacterium]|jgi:hypothetical protein|nr:hypothetical protein [Deltaproteobacteria bacterium]
MMQKKRWKHPALIADRFAFNGLLLLFIPFILFSGLRPAAWAGDVNVGDKVTIVTPGIEARLCPQPACGPDQHLTRIPEGTVLTVQGTDVFAIGTFNVKWFEVVYENQHGWISIYDTDKANK